MSASLCRKLFSVDFHVFFFLFLLFISFYSYLLVSVTSDCKRQIKVVFFSESLYFYRGKCNTRFCLYYGFFADSFIVFLSIHIRQYLYFYFYSFVQNSCIYLCLKTFLINLCQSEHIYLSLFICMNKSATQFICNMTKFSS